MRGKPSSRFALPSSGFLRSLLQANAIPAAEFRGWLFEAGMAFGTDAVWWGRGGRRPHPHEGVDLCGFCAATGKPRHLSAGTLVPVLYPGVVRAVTADFVAQSVWVRHGNFCTGVWALHSVYAHVQPVEGVRPGTAVEEGRVIARIAASARPSGPRPHLHLSVLLVHAAVPDEALAWDGINEGPGVVFLDPGPLFVGISI